MTMPSKITVNKSGVMCRAGDVTAYILDDIAEELARALGEVKMLHNDGPPLPLDIDKRSHDALARYNAINP